MAREDADFDEETAEEIEQEETWERELFEALVDAQGWLIKMNGAQFLPLFESEVLPFLSPIIANQPAGEEAPRFTEAQRACALCQMIDVLEHCGEGAQKFVPGFMPVLMEALGSDTMRQAAGYGLGMCARFGGAYFTRESAAVVATRLAQAVAEPDAQSEDKWAGTDNCVSAVGKMCRYRADVVDTAQLLPVWLSWLPLTGEGDQEEAKTAHSVLADFIEEANPIVLGLDATTAAAAKAAGLKPASEGGGGGAAVAAVIPARSMTNLPQLLRIFGRIGVGRTVDVDDSDEEDKEGGADGEEGEEGEDFDLVSEEDGMRLKHLLFALQATGDGGLQLAVDSLTEEERENLSEL
jgi:hypothetical protein